LNFNNQQIISAKKIKITILSISVVTNKLLKILNAYMFVGNLYRICLIGILKFTLQCGNWATLIGTYGPKLPRKNGNTYNSCLETCNNTFLCGNNKTHVPMWDSTFPMGKLSVPHQWNMSSHEGT
jgi:hypothetical protein